MFRSLFPSPSSHYHVIIKFPFYLQPLHSLCLCIIIFFFYIFFLSFPNDDCQTVWYCRPFCQIGLKEKKSLSGEIQQNFTKKNNLTSTQKSLQVLKKRVVFFFRKKLVNLKQTHIRNCASVRKNDRERMQMMSSILSLFFILSEESRCITECRT